MTVFPDVQVPLARLEAWLETMRGPDGYTGPVAHWWQNCLSYTGTGLDWRYEGIIFGYLSLYERTGDGRWLQKARRAGDDVIGGQLASGHFAGSCFELNPYTGGTPHEAACDLGLLALAETLKAQGQPDWQRYRHAANRNLRDAQLGRLWDADVGRLRDDASMPTFVPNKAATLVEAILALARLSDDGDALVTRFALPILDDILTHQIVEGRLRGGIWQNTYGVHRVEKLFPYYVARCVPALVAGYVVSGIGRYLERANDALDFVLRFRHADGGFPQIVYADGAAHTYPRWIAGVADIVRSIVLMGQHGHHADLEPTLSWLLAAQSPSGAFPTAEGFASQASGRQNGDAPSFRDLLPVVGWNDKAFRLLADLVPIGARLPVAVSVPYQTACTDMRQDGIWTETPQQFELRLRGNVMYSWEKGAPWAGVASPELVWK